MNVARVRLALAVVVFLAWIGWLAYLSETAARPIILSRPQFLVASLDIVAEVQGSDRPQPVVVVQRVVWPETPETLALVQQSITVANLPESDGWKQAGPYILPLNGNATTGYRVAPIPRSPGFAASGPPRIYPATPQTLQQLETIPKGAKTALPELEP